VKERPTNKSLIILIAEERDLLKYVANPDLRVFDYLRQVQKPTTIIYENAIGLASNLLSEDGSIAIRIVKDEFCKTLIKRFRKPLVSTSANLSGKPSPGNFSEITPEIKTGMDYIVRYRQDDVTPASSSTLAKWNANGTPSILRE
jgi:L-threonylcarbamoyladenylate synthase